MQKDKAQEHWKSGDAREFSAGNPSTPAVYDVLIIGAGLSGIGTAYWLQDKCPDKSYVILEARDAIGGTWDLFRYPGIRSDSDMFTFGYSFRPWQSSQAIADGATIRNYIQETARENGIDRHIRFGHQVVRASWSGGAARWTIHAQKVGTRQELVIQARFLYMCSGYYDYEQAHRPAFEGEGDFQGRIVHAQFWPEDLDYSGKQVVVIGSGATAVTIVPAMVEKAGQVTMLQRSPTYILPLPERDAVFEFLNRWLPGRIAYKLNRWKNLFFSIASYAYARAFPAAARRLLMRLAARELGPDYPVEKHFNPRYDPWDQRLCVIPDGDLFQCIRQGKAAVVTEQIERFTAQGIRLASGRELTADLIVLATGLQIKLMGGATLEVDGATIVPSEKTVYKGMMVSDVPNFAIAFGYINAPWTLKTDLTANFFCRLLQYMDRHGYDTVAPRLPAGIEPEPFMDFDAGYVNRARHLLPQQGSKKPWRVYQNYLQDMLTIRYGRINDGALQFEKKRRQA